MLHTPAPTPKPKRPLTSQEWRRFVGKTLEKHNLIPKHYNEGGQQNWKHEKVRPVLEKTVHRWLFGGTHLDEALLEKMADGGNPMVIALYARKRGLRGDLNTAEHELKKDLDAVIKNGEHLDGLKKAAGKEHDGLGIEASDSIAHLMGNPYGIATLVRSNLEKRW